MLLPALKQVCTIQRLLLQYLMLCVGPEIPSVTEKDNCYADVLQTALREYRTAHIRESIYLLFMYYITLKSQGTFMDGRRHLFRGPSCALTQCHGC